MQLLLQQQQLTNITINSFMGAYRWESGIAAVNQEEKEEAVKWMINPIILIGWEETDGLPTPSTQQPTAESNRGGIDRVCVASGRGKGFKNTTISRKRGVCVDAQLCSYVVICISIKLNDITTRNSTID
jgi:hypothetical protein